MMASNDNRTEPHSVCQPYIGFSFNHCSKINQPKSSSPKVTTKTEKNQPRTVQYLIWENYLIAVGKDNEQLSWGK